MIEVITYLINVIRWRFSEKKYLGKKFYFKGRPHTIVGETYHHFYIEETATSFLKDDYKTTEFYLLRHSKTKPAKWY